MAAARASYDGEVGGGGARGDGNNRASLLEEASPVAVLVARQSASRRETVAFHVCARRVRLVATLVWVEKRLCCSRASTCVVVK